MEQARQAPKKLNVFAQMGRESPCIAHRALAGRGDDDCIFRSHNFAISPHTSRELCWKSPALVSEGVGNAGRQVRPQPRV
jgi:hypothetical protein